MAQSIRLNACNHKRLGCVLISDFLDSDDVGLHEEEKNQSRFSAKIGS